MSKQKQVLSRLGKIAASILLLTAIIWLNRPLSLPQTTLTLAAKPKTNLKENSMTAPECVPTPQINYQALPSKSDLAFIHNNLLYVADGNSEKTIQLTNSGQALAPAWSHDGQWLAFLQVNNVDRQTGSLWLTRRDGQQAHVVQGLPGDVHAGVRAHGFAWSPTSNQLAVSISGEGLWLVSTVGAPEQLDKAPGLYSLAWSPCGEKIAYNVSLQEPGQLAEHDDAVCIIDIKQKTRQQVVTTPTAGARILDWWPDGQGLLYWVVPSHGGSVAADGVGIYSLPVDLTKQDESDLLGIVSPGKFTVKRTAATHSQPVYLTESLVYRNWADFTPDQHLLVVAGCGRMAWANKQLALVDPRTGAAQELPTPQGCVALYPAVSPTDGGIAFVAADELEDFWGIEKSTDRQRLADWIKSHKLWLRHPDGQLLQLSQAGPGVRQPRWLPASQHITYVAHDALWIVATDNQTPPRRIVALPQEEDVYGFYGYVSYDDAYAWYHHPSQRR